MHIWEWEWERRRKKNSIRRMRHTNRRESFDGWFGNKDDDGRLEFDIEYSCGSILVETMELLIAGDDLENSKVD
jgi:hypothetical protein